MSENGKLEKRKFCLPLPEDSLAFLTLEAGLMVHVLLHNNLLHLIDALLTHLTAVVISALENRNSYLKHKAERKRITTKS